MLKKLLLVFITCTISSVTIHSMDITFIQKKTSNTCIYTGYKACIISSLSSFVFANNSLLTKCASVTTSGFIAAMLCNIASTILCSRTHENFSPHKKNTQKASMLLTSAKGIGLCVGTSIGLMAVGLNCTGYNLENIFQAQN